MVGSQFIILILAFGLLTVSFIIGIMGIIKVLRQKSFEYYIFIILVGVTIIFLIPVILGIIQDLNL
jgi:hypothetical protein